MLYESMIENNVSIQEPGEFINKTPIRHRGKHKKKWKRIKAKGKKLWGTLGEYKKDGWMIRAFYF